MSFDLEMHILDHAFMVITNQYVGKNAKHFNTSVDTAYFIASGYDTQHKIDGVMVKIMNNISNKKMLVNEKNGIYYSRYGVKKQKYRKRIIRFNNLLIAYHNRHFDVTKSVNPHFHFLIPKNARVGLGYQYLLQVLHEEAKKFGVKFNFMEPKQEIGITRKQLQSIKRLSWHFNQGNTEKIEAYFGSQNQLKNVLNLLKIHYQYTNNLSFFLKTIKIIHQRLEESAIDYSYDGINLRKEVFFYLNDEDKELLDRLHHYEDVDLNLSHVLHREILKVAYGFSSDVMDILVDKFNILFLEKEKVNIIDSNIEIEFNNKKNKNHFRELVITDIRTAIAHAKSEKEIKMLLLDTSDYHKIAAKTQKVGEKRTNIGFEVTTQKKTKLFIPFYQLGLDYFKMFSVLKHNNRKKKKTRKIKSKINTYKKETKANTKSSLKLTKYIHRIKLLLVIYPLNPINKTKKKQEAVLSQKYEIVRSEMYDITAYMNQKTTIVDYGNKIMLKKSENMHQSVSDMLDIVQIKGWDIESIKIKGTNKLIWEVEKQIKERVLGVKCKNDLEYDAIKMM